MTAVPASPLYDPQRDRDPQAFPVHIAREVARETLDGCAGKDIHSHAQMMTAAVRLDSALRLLLAALDADAARRIESGGAK